MWIKLDSILRCGERAFNFILNFPKTVVIVKRTFMHVHIHVFDVVEMELDKWLQFEADI